MSILKEIKKKTNLNTALQYELESLPEIGTTLARRIINNRPYQSIYDLKKVKGIGDGTIKLLKNEVSVE